MHIDARKLDQQELFARLKEMLATNRECGEFLIEILVDTLAEANKVRAFASMSGCRAEILEKDDYFIIHLKGIPCCT